MIKFKYSLALLGLGLMMLSSIVPGFASTTTMKDTLGTDFSSNFGLVIDLNAQGNPNTNTINTNVQVLQDLGNPSNSKVNSTDQNPTYDQQFFFSHFNVSGVDNIYLALNKMEFDITFKVLTQSFDLGHVNGSAPFQTLLQYFQNNGSNILVANTFRGLIAYTTTANNGTIDSTDQSYFGYSFVEQHLINLLNNELKGKTGISQIPQYGFEPLYFPNNDTFGMVYTNYLVVWQSTSPTSPSSISSFVGNAFDNVVTGGNMVAASVFKYLKFTYHIEEDTAASNATTKVVNVITNYDLGPMSLLITNENAATYNKIVSADSSITSSNSFHAGAAPLSIANVTIGPTTYNAIVNLPDLSFYSGSAVSERINAAAMQGTGATGFGIAVASSTNAIVLGSTVNSPTQSTNSQDPNIPLSFGSNNFFTTNFSGKNTYTRTLTNGTQEAGLPIYVTVRAPSNLADILDTSSLLNGYFNLQTAQTIGIAVYSATQLNSAFTSTNTNGLSVASTEYVTLVQMPKWSGLQVTQDPTFSAVAAVASNNPSSSGSTSSTNSLATGAPGFELFTIVFAVIPLFIYRKKSRRN